MKHFIKVIPNAQRKIYNRQPNKPFTAGSLTQTKTWQISHFLDVFVLLFWDETSIFDDFLF